MLFVYALLIASMALSLYIALKWGDDLGLVLFALTGYLFVKTTKLTI
jgi:hypothetical protein